MYDKEKNFKNFRVKLRTAASLKYSSILEKTNAVQANKQVNSLGKKILE